jgi:hypothetical protein
MNLCSRFDLDLHFKVILMPKTCKNKITTNYLKISNARITNARTE